MENPDCEDSIRFSKFSDMSSDVETCEKTEKKNISMNPKKNQKTKFSNHKKHKIISNQQKTLKAHFQTFEGNKRFK